MMTQSEQEQPSRRRTGDSTSPEESENDFFDYAQFVRDCIPLSWKDSPNGWIKGNCPVCVENGESRNDTRGRGGFEFGADSVRYNCFNCGYRTGWSPGKFPTKRMEKLLIGLGADANDVARIRLEMMKHAKGRKSEIRKFAARRFEPDWPVTGLPEGSVPLSESDSDNAQCARRMIEERNLAHWDDWFIDCPDMLCRNRLMLPYRHEGKIVGFSARILDGSKSKRKYYSKRPKHYIFNLDSIMHLPNIILVEGEYDALTIKGASVCGSEISYEQADMLNRLGKKVIVLPDFDHTIMKRANTAIRHGWSMSFPDWGRKFKDANEAAQSIGRAFALKQVMNSVVDSPAGIRTRAKIMRPKA